MSDSDLSKLRTRRMILEFKYLDCELDEVNNISEDYVKRFISELIPEDINLFEPEETDEEMKQELLEEEKELKDMNSDILNRLYRKITKKTHPDKCDDEQLHEIFKDATTAYKAKNLPKILTIAENLNIEIPPLIDDDIKMINTNCALLRKKIENVKQQVAWRWCTAQNDRQKNEIKEWVKEQLITKVMKIFDYDCYDNDEQCSICLEIFRDGMKIAKLRCDHLFHTDCINRWFEVNFTCPLCKRI